MSELFIPFLTESIAKCAQLSSFHKTIYLQSHYPNIRISFAGKFLEMFFHGTVIPYGILSVSICLVFIYRDLTKETMGFRLASFIDIIMQTQTAQKFTIGKYL